MSGTRLCTTFTKIKDKKYSHKINSNLIDNINQKHRTMLQFSSSLEQKKTFYKNSNFNFYSIIRGNAKKTYMSDVSLCARLRDIRVFTYVPVVVLVKLSFPLHSVLSWKTFRLACMIAPFALRKSVYWSRTTQNFKFYRFQTSNLLTPLI